MTEPDPHAAGAPGGDPAAEDEPVEGTGETVGEAKWTAVRQLERRFPGLDKSLVRFEVLSEGERGLLGVGFIPARVLARIGPEGPRPPRRGEPSDESGSPAARLRELLERVCEGLDVPASASVSETDAALVGRLHGSDLGLLIGKRGQTIDAIQYLANATVWREGEGRKDVVVDAAGYRSRRQTALERGAEQAARDALATGEPVPLEPMSASERKIVHLYLQRRGGVTTSSEGDDPNRRVVVAPAARRSE